MTVPTQTETIYDDELHFETPSFTNRKKLQTDEEHVFLGGSALLNRMTRGLVIEAGRSGVARCGRGETKVKRIPILVIPALHFGAFVFRCNDLVVTE